ncbi:helix-turn-helix domain-containing protein [Arthrobacter sp. P2b]|uniref:helix-turn-helix domain-containing protein n=1 Tax=Arthrobacter sp. P2b TaxID=1938741 RepID=UPI0015921CD9|nr:helix-turn-helix domain-containing protein [Arthrobacter sp. P2b]
MQTIRAQETVQTIRAQDVEHEEINEVERVLATLPNSELAHQLQHILRSVRRGFDLNVISQDGKLTPKEAAEILQVSRPHVMALIKRGELTAEIVGQRDRRIPLSEITEFLKRKERASHDVAASFARRDSSKRALVARSAGVDPDRAKSLGY